MKLQIFVAKPLIICFCHPSGWQWIETVNSGQESAESSVSAILRDGSGLKQNVGGRCAKVVGVSAILRDGSGLKQAGKQACLTEGGFCHPSGWQWIETNETLVTDVNSVVSAILRDGSGLKH